MIFRLWLQLNRKNLRWNENFGEKFWEKIFATADFLYLFFSSKHFWEFRKARIAQQIELHQSILICSCKPSCNVTKHSCYFIKIGTIFEN